MKKNKTNKIRMKYHTDNYIYIVIIVLLSIIRFVPISLGSNELNDAVNDLAVGGCASALVAWLVDAANCSKKNKELQEKERMVFAEYCGAVNDLSYFIANRCKRFSTPTDEYDIKLWLEKLSDKGNYNKDLSPAVTMGRAYFHIGTYIRNIKSTLISLQQQYCMLVESDIVDTDDFRQHVTLQIRICNDICDALELNQKDYSNAADVVNEYLVELHDNAQTFFPEQIIKNYSWKANG